MEIRAGDYYPYAFLSAFTTIPKFASASSFFENEIRPIFDSHKKALLEMQRRNNKNGAILKEDTKLYNPVPYCLFGDFDMAVFSLIDDFSFATKKFKPSAGSNGFKYQMNTGIIPLIQTYLKGSKLFTRFKNKKLPDFFEWNKLYPFTGITTIKLNSAMLVGTGQEFLDVIKYYLISFLDNKIKEFEDDGVDMFFIINENLGWNELSIHFFGNSIEKMQQMLFEFRQKKLGEVKEHLDNLSMKDQFDEGKIAKYVLPNFKKIASESLLKALIGDKKGYDIMESHPVIATSITYGFHPLVAEMIENRELVKEKCGFSDKQFDFFMSECKEPIIKIAWNIKPGHEEKANKEIKKIILPTKSKQIYDKTSSGKYPFTYPAEAISFNQYINFTVKLEDSVRKKINRHVTKFRSRIQIIEKDDDSGINKYEKSDFNARKHYQYNLEKFRLGKDEVSKAQNRLRIFPIPYIYKSQLENLIINFNDAISDPLMYNYFIGLKQSLRNFLEEFFKIGDKDPIEKIKLTSDEKRQILQYENTPGSKPVAPDIAGIPSKNEAILEFIQTWNKAYWNRYFHSYYFNEINDFNIEHHGGVQQILLTYDVIYKLISKRIYGKNFPRPFLNVGAGHIITSSRFYCTLNFTHLFRPAVFASECVHEAVNHVIQYLVDTGKEDLELLLNPLKGTIATEKKNELEKMEKSIRDILGPIDESEVMYMQDNFGLNTIRQFSADYLTYKLAYRDPERSDAKNVESYYHTHWFTFLMRADLYARESSGQGSWYFMEEDFKVLFVRLNLVFYLGLGYNEKQLMQLNNVCPSVELKPLWESEKKKHVKFVARLGDALSLVLAKKIKNPESTKVGIPRLIDLIEKVVIREGIKNLSSTEKRNYETIIKSNREIIRKFNGLYVKRPGVRYNSIKRLSKNKKLFDIRGNKSKAETNVEFYENLSNQQVFIDPKGNLFSTSPTMRQEIYMSNILYIKKMWDLSMKIMIDEYKDDLVKKA